MTGFAGRSTRWEDVELNSHRARPVKVAIVEDHHTFRQCLEFLLKNTDGFRSAGSFRTMEEALEGSGRLPDVVLLDIGLPA